MTPEEQHNLLFERLKKAVITKHNRLIPESFETIMRREWANRTEELREHVLKIEEQLKNP